MGIEEYIEKDKSYKPQPVPKSKGFLDGVVCGLFTISNAERDKENIGKRKAYEEGMRNGYNLGWREFSHNLTNPESYELSDGEYKLITDIIAKLGYTFDYIVPISTMNNGHLTSKHIGLTVRKNLKAYDQGIVVSGKVKKQIIELLKGNNRQERIVEDLKNILACLDEFSVFIDGKEVKSDNSRLLTWAKKYCKSALGKLCDE